MPEERRPAYMGIRIDDPSGATGRNWTQADRIGEFSSVLLTLPDPNGPRLLLSIPLKLSQVAMAGTVSSRPSQHSCIHVLLCRHDSVCL